MSEDAASDTVRYRQQGHVVTIAYNRPDRRNAINGEMRQALNAAWARFRDDPDAWVAVLTGEGPSFCAGADLKDGAGAAGTWTGSFWEIPTLNSFESGWEIFKPTIAAVRGHCLGYGLTAALACDFVVAADDATFGFPEVRIGVPTIVGAIRLPDRVAWSAAMELLLTGERVDAGRAAELGLVWKVVPTDQVEDTATDLAARLCRAAPLAARATKEMAVRSRRLPWLESVRMGETMRRAASATDDAEEGVAAWAEGREPEWRGR